MNTEETKQKALALYINSLSNEKVAEQTGVSKKTIDRWEKQFNWKAVKAAAIQESLNSAPEMYQKLIRDQAEIADMANQQLIELLKSRALKPMEVIILSKHGLEIARPKKDIPVIVSQDSGPTYKLNILMPNGFELEANKEAVRSLLNSQRQRDN